MKLTQEEKLIKIAEACGIAAVSTECRTCDGTGVDGPSEADLYPCIRCKGTGVIDDYCISPNYFNDLNALYGAWESLTDDQKTIFAGHIRRLHEGMDIRVFAAFKHHGAECIGQTLNLWEAGQ